jgi:hypothetical protein
MTMPPEAIQPRTEAAAVRPGVVFELGTEQRYPLDLVSRSATIRQLYLDASADRWDPETDVDLAELADLTGVSEDGIENGAEKGTEAAQRRAGALVWSHRAWLEYRGIRESEAALVRMCVERDREVDAKYFLTARGTAKALAAEACWMVAERLGGYRDTPGSPVLTGLLRDNVARRGLHVDVDPDAFFFAHFVLGDSIDLALWRAYAAERPAREPLAVPQRGFDWMIERLVAAKARHAEFGWAYAEARALALTPEARHAVEANLTAVLAQERAGLRTPGALADRGSNPFTDELVAACDTAAAGPWAVVSNAHAERAFDEAVTGLRSGLARLGVSIDEPEAAIGHLLGAP